VTGASSGIGEATCRSLLEAGAKVKGWSRSEPSFLGASFANSFEWIKVDLSSADEIEQAFSKLEKLDAVVNNAGVAYLSSIVAGERRDWEEMLQVNVLALAQISQLAVPLLEESEVGQIINLSSMSGHRVPPSGGFYAPTKFAVRAITDALRWELRSANSGVRVSSISPGFVDTPLLDRYFAGREEKLRDLKASSAMLTPESIAEQVRHVLMTPKPFQVGDISLASTDQKV